MATILGTPHDLLTGAVAPATIGADGHPRLTAIVARPADDDTIETSLNTARHKYKNLASGPRVTIFRADPQAPDGTDATGVVPGGDRRGRRHRGRAVLAGRRGIRGRCRRAKRAV